MKLDMLHKPVTENKAAEAGHIALDLAGFVPGAGEVADIVNAIWYIKEKRWVSAALSLISVVPTIGDIAAKGIKYLGKGSVTFGKFMAKHGDDIAKGWIKAKPILKQSKKLDKYISDENMMKIDRAIEKVFSDSKKWNKEESARADLIQDIQRRIGESKSSSKIASRPKSDKPPKKTSTTTVGPEAPPYRWGTGKPMSGDGYDEHLLDLGS